MMKRKLNKPFPLIHPNPCVLIGTNNEESMNFTTIGDCAVAGLNPPLVFISLHQNHLAYENIQKTNEFSINIPNEDMVSKIDFCGVYSGRKRDKTELFDYTIIQGLPVINQTQINLICKVEHIHQIEQRVIIIARVKDTFIDEQLLINDNLNLEEVKPVVYGLDNKYYALGKVIETGYNAYKKV